MDNALGSDLTDKQLFFCREYMIDFNGKQAAIRAGYSAVSAESTSSEILSYPKVIVFLNDLKAKRAEKLEITAEKVLLELAKCGFSDVKDYFNEDFSMKELDDFKTRSKAIQSIQIDEFTSKSGNITKTLKFKLHDKLKALENIGKHIGFFKEDNLQRSDKNVFYYPEKDKDQDTSMNDIV